MTETVTVLLIGSGAREHALARALAHSASGVQVHCAPGNPGIASESIRAHDVSPTDASVIAALAQELAANLVVIGPEVPLLHGVADAVRAVGIPCFGPDQAAAQLEGSKAFAKEVMLAASVPTAAAHVCSSADEVRIALDAETRPGIPYVVKEDGLAAGKGVVVTHNRAEAEAHAASVISGGSRVLIEEYLDGPEVSLFFLSDGTRVRALVPAADFKRAYDNDEGPNTGGMGAYAPLGWVPDDLVEVVTQTVALPTVTEMARRGTPFIGLLYAGLALTSQGIKVVEFNARFGDPETQVVLALLETPLFNVLLAAATGALEQLPELQWRDESAVVVVMAAAGYPSAPRAGDVITGDLQDEPDSWVLHAGTAINAEGELITAGGRVLSVVARGTHLAAARERAYERVSAIDFAGCHSRSDIALGASISNHR